MSPMVQAYTPQPQAVPPPRPSDNDLKLAAMQEQLTALMAIVSKRGAAEHAEAPPSKTAKCDTNSNALLDVLVEEDHEVADGDEGAECEEEEPEFSAHIITQRRWQMIDVAIYFLLLA